MKKTGSFNKWQCLIIGIFIMVAVTGCDKKDGGVFSTIDPIRVTEKSSKFNDSARFIAGLDVSESSPLYPLTKKAEYKKYSDHINKIWKGFLLANMEKSRKWAEQNIPENYSSTVFYPFSGPDILHPLIFYPTADDVVMFGLEKIGNIPDPMSLQENKRIQGLWSLTGTLDFTLDHAFFVTSDMQKRVGKNTYTGITAVMMFFLARGGFDVDEIKHVWINKSGVISFKEALARNDSVLGIEIIFHKGNEGKLRRVRFFRLDISDRSKKLPQFISYLRNYPPFSTVVKSASYLMHLDEFGKIRNALLQFSNCVLQDDSGMANSSFSEKDWKMTYHGLYHRPIPVFKNFYQGDLDEKLKKNSTGPLPFVYGYGYGYGDMKYHLVYAQKIKPSLSNKPVVKKR